MLVPSLVLVALSIASPPGPAGDPVLAGLIRDVRAKCPSLAIAAQRSVAARAHLEGAGSLANPMLSFRTTTDRGGGAWDALDLEVMATQALPPRGRRKAETDQAGARFRVAGAERDDAELVAIAAASRWYFELAHLSELRALRRDELVSLRAFAESARGRYASGEGRQQDALHAQAEITRAELSLIEIEARRSEALAALNELRGRASTDPFEPASLPSFAGPDNAVQALDSAALLALALDAAPTLSAARAAEDAARADEALARLASAPEISVGGFYELMDVGRGVDAGDRDEVGIVVGMSLPMRRRRSIALVDEALANRLAAASQTRATASALEREIATLVARADEARRALDLGATVLTAQTDESLRSALAGYSSGVSSSLDVLVSMRLAYDARSATLRSRADEAIALSILRAIVGGSLPGEARPEASEAEPPAPRSHPVHRRLPR